MQARTSAAISSSAAWRSATVTPGYRPRGARAAARTQPRSHQELGELDRVGRGALAQVVADDPEREPAVVGDARVLADAADVDLVGAGGLGRERVGRGRRVVLDHDAGDRGEQRPGAVRRDRLARLDVDGLAVGHEDRDADGRRADAQVRQVEDLAALGDDLPLFLGVAVVEEDVDLRAAR